MKKKLLIICGPTATGKTKLGVDLAKKFDGEIVSADSRQVYRGMDIITGKDKPEGIKIWLYDAAGPDQRFSVADYYELALKVVEDIWGRGKLPIVVGGTGFYIKALMEGIETMGIGPDWDLRSKLSNCQINELQIYLKKMDCERWEKMNESDRQNPRRLIRAIEIAQNSKSQTLISKQITNSKLQRPNVDYLTIGLTAPYKFLYERIDQRVDERVKMGAVEEIKKLLSEGYGWDNSVLGQTIGYQEWRDCFEGKANKEEAIQRWKFDEHGYSRRQMTWFKKIRDIHWSDVTKDDWREEVEKRIKAWYS